MKATAIAAAVLCLCAVGLAQSAGQQVRHQQLPVSSPATDTLKQWHATDFAAYVPALRKHIPGSGQTFAIEDLDSFNKHQIRFIHLTGNGNPEMHEKKVVVYIVQDGEATVLNGGRLVNVTAHRWRGTGIEGAHAYAVQRGDVIKLPNGEAHQILVAPGTTMAAMSLVIDVE